MKRKVLSNGWLLSGVLLALFRLFLTSDRDILALDSGHDEFFFVHAAAHWIWRQPYSEMVIIHLPIYPMWLTICHFFGIPGHLAIDCAWVAASGYLAFALARLTNRKWLGCAAFAYLTFHPYVFAVFDRTLPETLLTALSAAVLAGGIELWNCRLEQPSAKSRTAAMVYTLGFALAFHTRKEGVTLLAPLIVLAVWSAIDRRQWWSRDGRARLAGRFLIAPSLATLILGTLLVLANYLSWGVLARHDLAAGGYQRALGTLNRINVGRSPRHIAVSRKALAAAYVNSPTFAELKPFLEGDPGRGWASFSGIPDEIANGWFYWAVRDAAARAGWHKNSRLAEKKYYAVARELESAFSDGRLKEWPLAVSSFVDPDIGKWIGNVPGSIATLTDVLVNPRREMMEEKPENATESQFAEYVAIVGRRRMPTHAIVAGWVIAPSGSEVFLGTSAAAGTFNLTGDERPDVPGARAFRAASGMVTPMTELYVRAPNGKMAAIPLASLRVGRVNKLAGELDSAVGVDELDSAQPPRLDRWLLRANTLHGEPDWLAIICRGYAMLSLVFSITAAVAAILAAFIKSARGATVMLIIVGVATIFGRLALFGILDASSWNGVQVRYLLPAIPALVTVGVLGLALMLDVYAARRAGRQLAAAV